jgi:hypothetical protein
MVFSDFAVRDRERTLLSEPGDNFAAFELTFGEEGLEGSSKDVPAFEPCFPRLNWLIRPLRLFFDLLTINLFLPRLLQKHERICRFCAHGREIAPAKLFPDSKFVKETETLDRND